MSKAAVFTNDEARVIADRYLAGGRFNDLVKEYGTNYPTLRHTIERVGVPVILKGNKISFNPDDAEIVRRMVAEKGSQTEIGDVLGCGVIKVKQIMREYGITPAHRRPLNGRDQRFTSAEQDEIAEKYTAGVSTTQLIQEYGTSLGTVRRLIENKGIRFRARGGQPRIFSDLEIADMFQMASEGYSQANIAKKFHVSTNVIQRVMKGKGFGQTNNPFAHGDNHGLWKGGRVKTFNGYWLVYIEPDHLFAAMRTRSGYVPEHRFVMAQRLGRSLEKYESVHHIDGDRSNNDISNLQLRQGKHGKGVIYRCLDCGSHNVMTVPITEH